MNTIITIVVVVVVVAIVAIVIIILCVRRIKAKKELSQNQAKYYNLTYNLRCEVRIKLKMHTFHITHQLN